MTINPRYDPLIALWATLPSADTTAQKLAAVNAMTVAGPNVDVTTSQVVSVLLLAGAYPTLAAFAAGTTGAASALSAAKTLMDWVTVPNAPLVQMSNPTVFAEVQQLGNAVVAQETASPGSTGFTQTVLNDLLALAATTVPWWQANGLTSAVSPSDLTAAGGLT
jgi:hypothetical protein